MISGVEFRRRSGGETGLRRFLLTLPLIMVAGGCKVAEVPREEREPTSRTTEDVTGEITGMLQESAASWNAGDLAGFLDDYWNSDELTFSGSTGVTRGWEDVRRRYLTSYWAPGASRDSLRFEAMEALPLGSEHALAMGRYVLFRPHEDGETVSGSGYFSLVLRRTVDGWKIIHDHTSASPQPEGTG